MECNLNRLVFVSHSGEDTWVAKQIAACIKSKGATAFLDEADSEVGAEFEEHILNFLDKADEFLVLFTPWSLQRPYVWAEWRSVDPSYPHCDCASWSHPTRISNTTPCTCVFKEKGYDQTK